MTAWTLITYTALVVATAFLVVLLVLPIVGIISYVIEKLSD